MAGFVQIIEITTSRIEEVQKLSAEYRATRQAEGAPSEGTPVRGLFTADRDRENHYVNIVEFDSYETAMANSQRPDTTEFAAQLAALCDEPPRFRNLDVREVWQA